MSMEALRAALEAEGRERAAGLLRDAEATASRLRAEASAAAARKRQEALQRAEEELRRAARARVAAARGEARRRVLEAREELLGRVFRRAADSASAALAAPELRAWLVSALRRALELMPEGSVAVHCSPELESDLREAVREHASVRLSSDPGLPAGLRSIGAGGALVVDATVERILERRWPELSIGVLEQLEGREGTG